MSLVDRVIAIKQVYVSQLPHGSSLSDAQEAEILIAQVAAIMAGDDPEASEEALAAVDAAAYDPKTQAEPGDGTA